ncbi:translation initiation factor IF-2 [Candidatus Spongiihabitans sp.]|uniref:translation initiation factor IF-2 n=1 Tax=Candidatus Spongiihabitans sp. TaxID=3101308 RepID=UPI003C6FA631
MSQITISNFAKQIGISIDKLLNQLAQAGISGKVKTDLLVDDEKIKLLQYLKGDASQKQESNERISLNRKTIGQIKQTSRTGAAHTVHIEVKKRRTFVKRGVLEAQQAEAQAKTAALEAEQKRIMEEQKQKSRQAKEQAKQAEQERLRVEQEALEKSKLQESQGPTDELQADARSSTEDDSRKEAAELAESAEGGAATSEISTKQTTVQSASEMPPAPESTANKQDDKPKKGRKGKRGKPGSNERAGRKELHATKRRKDRARRQPLRKPGNISSSIADQHAFEKPTEPVIHEVHVPETITVGELAQAMSIKAGEVIKAMMGMGSMVTINQILDQDTAILLVEEMGHIAQAADADDPEAFIVQHGTTEQLPRAPVVTVMGHVDHGKTSLLDYLRKTKVAASEAGGITQHIGAYKVKVNEQEICFLDTPGHEAFSAMRARGAKATDLIILVVAADDGVKPQTIEAINHAKAAEVPVIVAINKIDKEQADPERVKQELANHEVIAEAWGGDVLMSEVSAITGQGTDELLESVLLQAEVADLKAHPAGNATGLVVEARLDKGRGPVATVLVQQGSLKPGDIVLAGRETGRVRVLIDDQGRKVSQAGPSTPVEIQGLTGVPVAGDDLVVVSSERKAREIALNRQGKSKEQKLAQQQKAKLESMFNRMEEGEAKTLNVLIKADVHGSVEALRDSLEKLSVDEVNVNVIHGMVGGINESDVNLALAADAIMIGFNVRADAMARKLIDNNESGVFYHNVIYDVVDTIKATMTGMLSKISKEEHVGLIEVRDIFRAPKIGAIAGCFVSEGAVKRHLPVRVLRDNMVIFEGAINSLRRFKEDVAEVKNGYECGIGIKDYNDIKIGDQIEVFEIVQTAQKL